MLFCEIRERRGLTARLRDRAICIFQLLRFDGLLNGSTGWEANHGDNVQGEAEQVLTNLCNCHIFHRGRGNNFHLEVGEVR